jgi:hypothetical protein
MTSDLPMTMLEEVKALSARYEELRQRFESDAKALSVARGEVIQRYMDETSTKVKKCTFQMAGKYFGMSTIRAHQLVMQYRGTPDRGVFPS